MKPYTFGLNAFKLTFIVRQSLCSLSLVQEYFTQNSTCHFVPFIQGYCTLRNGKLLYFKYEEEPNFS